MTSPVMLPGFWDQNGSALMQLAQTITRTVNPYFDSQVALMEGIRKNPEAMSQIVDMAYLNPDMFAQQFGPRMLQRFSQGAPSVEARTQEAQRGMFDKNPDSVPQTTGNMAAQVGLGIGTQQNRRATQVGIEGAELSNEGRALSNSASRLELEFAGLKAPIERARIARIQQVLDENKGLSVFNYMDMAKRFVEAQESGTPDADLDSQLQYMRTMNEEAYPLFQEYVDLYAAQRRDEAAETRQRNAEQRQTNREESAENRERERAARNLMTRFPSIPLEDAIKFYTPGEEENMSSFSRERLLRNEAETQRRDRYEEFFKITDQFKRISGTRNRAERDLQRSNIATSIGRLINVQGLRIENIDREGSLIGKESVYVLPDGTRLVGEDLQTLLDDPTSVGRFQTRTRIMNMSEAELVSEEAAIKEAIEAGMYTPTEAQYYSSAVTARRDVLKRTRGR